ncbi:unnamed protein product [Oikopleura dioica]|uniref:Uncharacterized protein n=1 Tax=Oikopleura dioica TaxID=34765 RepID=E4X9M6_OIKDI|nr:unnamed protein product [Oikopleura dioica]
MRLAASVLLLCHSVNALCKKRECTEYCKQVKADMPLQTCMLECTGNCEASKCFRKINNDYDSNIFEISPVEFIYSRKSKHAEPVWTVKCRHINGYIGGRSKLSRLEFLPAPKIYIGCRNEGHEAFIFTDSRLKFSYEDDLGKVVTKSQRDGIKSIELFCGETK